MAPKLNDKGAVVCIATVGPGTALSGCVHSAVDRPATRDPDNSKVGRRYGSESKFVQGEGDFRHATDDRNLRQATDTGHMGPCALVSTASSAQ